MKILPHLLFVYIVWVAMSRTAVWAEDFAGTADEAPPAVLGKEQPERMPFQPCFGAGYLPYAYPGFDTCPCGNDGCFHPNKYFCGGKAYRRQWLRKWVRSHLGRGSMLEGYPCPCIFPTTGRTYFYADTDRRDLLGTEAASLPDGLGE